MLKTAEAVLIFPTPSPPRLRAPAILQERRCGPADLLFCSSVFLFLCLCSFSNDWHDGFRPYFADDAYYYLVIARHMALEGRSSFDGSSITNGYQPLWMFLVFLQYKFFSSSLVCIRTVEYALGLAGLLFSLVSIDLPSALTRFAFTLSYFFLLSVISFNGMESGLFCCIFILLFYVSRQGSDRSVWPGCRDGALAALAIGARLDSVFFVVPLLLISGHSLRRRIAGLLVLGVSAAAYLGLNRYFFGLAEPISGKIKTLGGLQWNRMALSVVSDPSSGEAILFFAFLCCIVAIPFFFRFFRSRWERALAKSFLIGSLFYVSRILFLSSWKIWSWYEYPALIGFLACAPVAARRLNLMIKVRPSLRAMSLGCGVAMLAGGLFVLYSFTDHPHRLEPGFAAVNRKLLKQYGAQLNGASVAMGDRAGEFALQYAGGVAQTEGLVNDAEYLNRLKDKGDVKQILCGRSVRYLIAYEPDLGSYRMLNVETIRRHLSQYAAPTIPVSAADEIGRVSNAPEFDAQEIGDVDKYLYLWRLNCPS